MLSKLVEKGINLDNKGGKWLLLILEEAQLAQEKKADFSVRKYLFSLNMNSREVAAAYSAMEKSLKDAFYKGNLRQFIEECIA